MGRRVHEIGGQRIGVHIRVVAEHSGRWHRECRAFVHTRRVTEGDGSVVLGVLERHALELRRQNAIGLEAHDDVDVVSFV